MSTRLAILRAMWRTLFVLVMLSGLVVAAQTPPGDEAAVRAVITQYVQARTLKDPKAIAALFTAEADQRTTSGEWRRGLDRMVTGMLQSSQQNPGDRGITVEAVRFIGPDVAIADGPYDIGGNRRAWTTIVLRREGGTWRIAAIRNMVATDG